MFDLRTDSLNQVNATSKRLLATSFYFRPGEIPLLLFRFAGRQVCSQNSFCFANFFHSSMTSLRPRRW